MALHIERTVFGEDANASLPAALIDAERPFFSYIESGQNEVQRFHLEGVSKPKATDGRLWHVQV